MDIPRLGVLADVGEQLAAGLIEEDAQGLVEFLGTAAVLEVEGDAEIFLQLLARVLQRGGEAELIEERRAQLGGQAANLLERVLGELLDSAGLGGVGVLQALLEHAQLDAHQREHLADGIVQHHRELLALALLGQQQRRRQLAQVALEELQAVLGAFALGDVL